MILANGVARPINADYVLHPMITNNIYYIAIIKFPPTYLYPNQEDDEEDQDEDWDDDLDDEEVINMKVTLVTFLRVQDLSGSILGDICWILKSAAVQNLTLVRKYQD